MERKEILTVVMIGVLLLTVGLQTIQLVSLGSAQVIVPSTSVARAPVASGGSSPVSANGGGSLANLPSMVGGC